MNKLFLTFVVLFTICTLETMDIPLNEYLIMEFENRIKSCHYECIK